MILLLAALVVASVPSAHAQTAYETLIRVAGEVGEACVTPELRCRGDYALKPIRARGGLAARLQAVADEQNNGWADTILEGDYTASHRTELVGVQFVLKDGEKVAYRIVYRARAHDTSGAAEGQAGISGYITEAAFVSLDFKSAVVDDQALASFKPSR